MVIKELKLEHLALICQLHRASFSNDHFVKYFSVRKTQEYFGKLILNNEYKFGAFDSNDKLIGFLIAGSKTRKTVDDFIWQNFIYLIFVMLIHPKFLIEKSLLLYERFFKSNYLGRSKIRLISIATDNSATEKGVGKSLINHFENKIKEDKIITYGLSVRKKNEHAIGFYYKSNFMKEGETETSIYFIKKINA